MSDLIKELGAGHVLHHQVDVLLIIVRFIVLDDVGVVERVQNGHFLHDAIDVITQLYLVEDLYGNLEVFIVLVRREEDTAKCANS